MANNKWQQTKDKQYVYRTNTDWFGFGLEIIHDVNQQYEIVIAFTYNVAELQLTEGNRTISDENVPNMGQNPNCSQT